MKEKQLKPKVEEPINIDNGTILLIITHCVASRPDIGTFEAGGKQT